MDFERNERIQKKLDEATNIFQSNIDFYSELAACKAKEKKLHRCIVDLYAMVAVILIIMCVFAYLVLVNDCGVNQPEINIIIAGATKDFEDANNPDIGITQILY